MIAYPNPDWITLMVHLQFKLRRNVMFIYSCVNSISSKLHYIQEHSRTFIQPCMFFRCQVLSQECVYVGHPNYTTKQNTTRTEHQHKNTTSSPVVQCVSQRAPICSNTYGDWFAPRARHSVRMAHRPSAALRLLGSLRISHKKFLRVNK